LMRSYFGADRNAYYLYAVQNVRQGQGESIETYVARLRQLIKYANQNMMQINSTLEISQFIAGLADPVLANLVSRKRNNHLFESSNAPFPPMRTLDYYVRLASNSAPLAFVQHQAAHPGACSQPPLLAPPSAVMPYSAAPFAMPCYPALAMSPAVPYATASVKPQGPHAYASFQPVPSQPGPLAAATVDATVNATPTPPVQEERPRSPPYYHPYNTAGKPPRPRKDNNNNSKADSSSSKEQRPRSAKAGVSSPYPSAYTCFNCMQKGHGSRECSRPRDDVAITKNRATWKTDQEQRRNNDLDARVKAILRTMAPTVPPQAAPASSDKTLN
jgi:hypothetical protein